MKSAIKITFYVIGVLAVFIVLGVGYLSYAYPNVGAPSDLEVELTPEKVERGKYLAFHVMMCADCHAKRDFSLFSGPPKEGTLFAGGEVFDEAIGLPGKFISPNITPAGIGDWTDGEVFRALTAGVNKDGDPLFPIMPYQSFGKLDTADIEAVIAFLRTLDPIETNHPKSEANFPFNFILKTIPKDGSPSPRPAKSDTLAYGAYMFTAAGCGDCHTNFKDGKFVGPVAAGGREMMLPDGSVLRTPNLTPHETGIKNKYTSKQQFIDRFAMYRDSVYSPVKVQAGKLQTIMPWMMYAGMKDEDIGAIYEYLQSLDPVDHMVVSFTPAGAQ